MEPKVIEEIAEQLGMAVGEAGKFVEGILPQYAVLQAMDSATGAVLALLFVVVGAVVVKETLKTIEDAIKKREEGVIDRWEYDHRVEWRALFVAVICATLFIVIIVLFSGVCDAIGWALFPEAKLLDMAIAAVQN